MTAAGTIIGRFELLRLLAAGGMGEVYLARVQSSVDGFGALAAIKVLPKNLSANQTFVKMFLDEARAIGKLHHKNIVQVRDIAEHEGQYYMVMEYIAGQNLREFLGDASIPDRPLFEPRLGTEIFIDIASALGAAHAEGLVHRDVSPNNIMIGDEGTPKLIDFGVARARGSSSLTNPGTLKGKFGYMSPEYVRAQAYDHRADIFSLGVVMWETFARRRLFRGTSAAEQLHQLLESEIPRLDQILPDFPTDLATMVAGALERDPQHRIASANMLVDALTEISRALPVGQDLTLRKWLERRIPGRLEDRRRMDQTLLGLPPGSAIPDFGVAYPDAGSTPGTYGFDGTGAARLSEIMRPDTEVKTSPRGEPPPPQPISLAPRSSRNRTIAIVAGLAIAIAVVFALAQDRGGSPADTTGSSATPPGSAGPAIAQRGSSASLIEAHRQIGLKALADGDYDKARAEFDDAVQAGGSGDLDQLRQMAIQLAHDDKAKAEAKAEAKADATTKPPTKPPTVAAVEPHHPEPPAKAPPRRNLPRNPKHGGHEATVVTAREPASETAAAPPPPAATNFAVFSLVPKATVLVDGAVVGTTPLLVKVTPGEHQLVVKAGDQVLHAARVSAAAGETTRINVETPLAAKAPPKPIVVTEAPRPPAPPLPSPTPRVSSNGDVDVGARVVAGACNGCHRKLGKSAVAPRQYAQAQWERFFATGQHDRYQRLGDEMTASQMKAARAYLRANAADTAENQGAGVRE